METFNKLVEWFVKNGGDRAIVALSGGVDSAVVALAAKKALGNGAIAITADYKTLAEEELAAAWRVAREIGIKHKVIEYNELENTSFVKNDIMRCYYCRTELGQRLAANGRRYVEQRHDLKVTTARLVSLYEQVIAAGPST